MKLSATIVAFFLSGYFLTAAPEVTVKISPESVRIGDVIECHISSIHPKGSRLNLPEIEDGKKIIIKERNVSEQNADNEQVQSDYHYQLYSLEVGSHILSTNEITYVDAEGNIEKFLFPEQTIEVVTVLSDTNQFAYDIKEPVKLSARVPKWAWMSALVCLAILALFLLNKRFVRRRPDKEIPLPVIPAHIKAQQALQELKDKRCYENNEVEYYYVKLSLIVRTYLEDRFNLMAPEMTTEEFIRETANDSRLSPTHRDSTSNFLEQSDLVKFAQMRPGQNEMEAAMESAVNLVNETTPELEETSS